MIFFCFNVHGFSSSPHRFHRYIGDLKVVLVWCLRYRLFRSTRGNFLFACRWAQKNSIEISKESKPLTFGSWRIPIAHAAFVICEGCSLDLVVQKLAEEPQGAQLYSVRWFHGVLRGIPTLFAALDHWPCRRRIDYPVHYFVEPTRRNAAPCSWKRAQQPTTMSYNIKALLSKHRVLCADSDGELQCLYSYSFELWCWQGIWFGLALWWTSCLKL